MKTGLSGETFLGYAGALEVRSDALDCADNHAEIESTSGCALQAQKHTGMFDAAAKHTSMDRTPDERREILRAFMKQAGLKPGPWAKEAHVSPNSLYNFLNGHSEALDAATYGKLARVAQVPSWQLSGDRPEIASPTTIWVAGYVEAGAFREAVEWDRSRWYPIDVPVDNRFQKIAKALEVRGPSMNLEYRPGSIVLWVNMLDARAPKHGDHVIVYAYRDDDTVEATVKELRIVNGHRWLWPRSDDPDHQQPIDPTQPGDGIKMVEIQGLVIGDYRKRHI